MKQECRKYFKESRTCVLVPTYNNVGTIIQVLERIVPFAQDIIVVNDGSTDQTPVLLESFRLSLEEKNPLLPESEQTHLTLVSYSANKGKGGALREGFRKALSLGFRNAITIDSDGQHYPEDLPLFADAMSQNPGTLIVGNRKLVQKNMPGKNTFANYFSNFWFMLQTWQYLPDTQTGYRVYPLNDLHGLDLLTCRYEAELELLVMAAWHGVKLVSVPIRVYYPPQDERVSHFRPLYDFSRISLLNTVLCILCIVYGWWSMLWHKITTKHFRRKLLTQLCLLIGGLLAIVWIWPTAFVFRALWPKSEKMKLKFHKILRNYFSFILYHIPGVRIDIANRSELDNGKAAVIICNHQSNLELLTLLTLSPKIVALTNERVWNYWLYGPVLQYLEFYPATEGLDNSMDHISSLLERGYSVVVFPEGTRSTDCHILKFHRGAFYMAEQLRADILPVYVAGAGSILPKQEMIFNRGTLRMQFGKRIDAADESMGQNYREKTRNWHKHYLKYEEEHFGCLD